MSIIKTIGDESNPEPMSTASVSVILNGTPAPAQKLVKVLIKYPEDYSKRKFFKDGDIKEVSEETAATFIAAGIATNPDEQPPVEDPTPEDGDIKEVSEETAPEKVSKPKGKKQ